MDAMEIYGDIVSACVDTETCPHGVLPHVTDAPGMDALVDHLVGISADAFRSYAAGMDDGTDLGNTLVHALVIMAGVGYSIGAEHAYDIALSSDVVVPDSLAALDFLEPMDGGRD